MTQTKSVLEAFKEHVPTDEELVEWLALLTEHKASIRGCDVLAGVAAFRLHVRLTGEAFEAISARKTNIAADFHLTMVHSKNLLKTESTIQQVREFLTAAGEVSELNYLDNCVKNIDTFYFDPCFSPAEFARMESSVQGNAELSCVLTPHETPFPADEMPLYAVRELTRLKSGGYTPMTDKIRDQIPSAIYITETPHLATKGSNAGKVAYTESHAKGEADVQSVMKPGKYLRRVLKNQDLNDQQLKEMVAELQGAANFEVKTTRDPDVAKWVYLNGPDSCMSKGDERFDETYDLDGAWRHPIEALFFADGSGDVELAYIEAHGRPAARVLTNAEWKLNVCIYCADWMPSASRALKDWLEENGYEHDDDALRGIRIPRIELQDNKVLCPYIDGGGQGIDIDSMTIGGDWKAEYTDGFVDPDNAQNTRCEICEDRLDEDDMTLVPCAHGHVCESCLDNDFVEAYVGGGNVAYIHGEDAISLGFLHRLRNWRFDHIHEGVNLADVDLCETYNDIIAPVDDCSLAEDDNWVHCDDISEKNRHPRHGAPDYVHTDAGVHPTEDCLWNTDTQEWDHEDDFDTDEYEESTIEHGVRALGAIETEKPEDA